MADRAHQPRRDRLSYRRRRRAQRHEDAVAEGAGQPPVEIPEHPLIPARAPEMITTTGDLHAMVEHVRGCGSFAYDTEFIGELSYHPQICLIQVATPQRIALIDPMEEIDLTALWELIADPSIETIVHAGEQDLEPVVRHLDRPPANILDVQIAAAFIGLPYPLALRALVHVLVGVRLGKGMTFTQWDHRPLLPVHLGYAADDVRYLPAASKRIHEQLEALGHTSWAIEACGQLTDLARYRFDAQSICQRIRGVERLAPRDRERLARLASVRDDAAREEDVPPRTLLQDPVLMRLVRHPVRTIDDLRGVKGLPRPVAEQHGARIIEALAVKDGAAKRSTPPLAPPVEETALDRTRIDSLFAVASSYCRARRVDTNLVLNRSDIAKLHFRQLRGAPLEDLRIMQGWRGELLGTMLQAFMAGTLQLTVGWREGDLEVEEKSTKHKAQSTKKRGHAKPDVLESGG